MPSRIKLVCPAPSVGARAVVNKLNELGAIAKKVATWNPRLNRSLLVGWGSDVPGVDLNKPDAIRRARDKLNTFNALKQAEVPIPLYAETKAEAEAKRKRGDMWLARTRGGTGGSGIKVVRDGEPMPNAQLYVRYTPKQREFRTHVFRGQVIHWQEKKKRNGVTQDNNQKLIRSHDNGWVFCENNLDISDTLRAKLAAVSARALTALGLDFAAFDLILSKDGRNVIVLEANTRPGVESNATATAYANALLAAARG
jgi:biotin carboxylase